MATQIPPKKNTAYTFTTGLTSQANTKVFQSNPTLEGGDVKVRTDSGSLANITTLPSVVSSGKLVDVTLSASEMNGDRIQVLFSDASGDEWCDFIYEIDTSTTQVDDVATASNLTTLLNRIGAFTGSGVNTVLGFLKAMMSKVASTPSDVGGTFSATTDALEALQEEIASHDTGTGSGARTVTITVDDGTDPLEAARVRLQQGAESYVANTNASGVITFGVDDATWSVRITKAGYTFTPTTLVVNGDETQTYSMTSTTPAAPANPELATGYVYCYDESGVAEQGVTITCWMTAGPGDDGYAWDATEFTMTSDVNGLASHAFVRGATYKANRGTAGRSAEFTVPTDSGTFDIDEILGSP